MQGIHSIDATFSSYGMDGLSRRLYGYRVGWVKIKINTTPIKLGLNYTEQWSFAGLTLPDHFANTISLQPFSSFSIFK